MNSIGQRIFPFLCFNRRFSSLKTIGNVFSSTPFTQMVQSACLHESFAGALLHRSEMTVLWNCAHSRSVEICYEALTTLRALLTRHKTMASEELKDNFLLLNRQFQSLLSSDNLWTCRLSISVSFLPASLSARKMCLLHSKLLN